MALIKCPECGREVSDMANNCPNCGYPIKSFNPKGIVKIKLSTLKTTMGSGGYQKVTIFQNAKAVWEGMSGDVAELFFDGETYITIRYHMSIMHYDGECSGLINPAKSKKYSVSARQGIMSTKLVLQPVDDIFDAD